MLPGDASVPAAALVQEKKCPKVLYEGYKVLVVMDFGILKARTAPVYILNFFKQKLSRRTVSHNFGYGKYFRIVKW